MPRWANSASLSSPCSSLLRRRCSEGSLCLRSESLPWSVHSHLVAKDRALPRPCWERGQHSTTVTGCSVTLTPPLAVNCHSNASHAHHWFPPWQHWVGLDVTVCSFLYCIHVCPLVAYLKFLLSKKLSGSNFILLLQNLWPTFSQYIVVAVLTFTVRVPCLCYLIVSPLWTPLLNPFLVTTK